MKRNKVNGKDEVIVMNDPGILCFKHCDASVYCKSLPEKCPVCRKELSDAHGLMPFRIPYPFVRGKQMPCSVLLKPSNGDFLNCYSVNADLHIGVTTSSCTVIEYDVHGLSKLKTDLWNESLVVYTLEDVSWYKKWNNALAETAEEYTMSNKRYSEDDCNCYSFVLSFAKRLQYKDLTDYSESKEIFSKNLVLPGMAVACKYVFLFRKLFNDECYVEK